MAVALVSSAFAQTAPKPRDLFLVRSPDGQVTAIRATSFENQGGVLVIISETGSRAVVQSRSVIARLPWYSDEELESGAVKLPTLAATYRSYAPMAPGLRPFLQREAARFEAMEKSRNDADAARTKAAQERLAAATATTYDPARAYSTAEIEELLAAADAVGREQPEAVASLETWAAPFREHLRRLQAGDQIVDGAWVTKDDLARQAQADREAAFRATLDYPLAPVALPAEIIAPLVRNVALAAAAAMLLGLGLLVLGRKRGGLRLPGLILLVGPPVGLAALYFLLTRDPADLPRRDAALDEQPLVAALAEAARVSPDLAPQSHVVPENAINSLLARRVRIDTPAEPAPWAAVREGLAVRVLGDRVSIFELLRCAGRPWIARYDLTFQPGVVGVTAVSVGAVELPANLSASLWKSLEPQLLALLEKSALPATFALTVAGNGQVALTPRDATTPGPQTPPPTAAAVTTPESAPTDETVAPEPGPDPTAAPLAPPAPTPTPTPLSPPSAPPAATPARAADPTPSRPPVRDKDGFASPFDFAPAETPPPTPAPADPAATPTPAPFGSPAASPTPAATPTPAPADTDPTANPFA